MKKKLCHSFSSEIIYHIIHTMRAATVVFILFCTRTVFSCAEGDQEKQRIQNYVRQRMMGVADRSGGFRMQFQSLPDEVVQRHEIHNEAMDEIKFLREAANSKLESTRCQFEITKLQNQAAEEQARLREEVARFKSMRENDLLVERRRCAAANKEMEMTYDAQKKLLDGDQKRVNELLVELDKRSNRFDEERENLQNDNAKAKLEIERLQSEIDELKIQYIRQGTQLQEHARRLVLTNEGRERDLKAEKSRHVAETKEMVNKLDAQKRKWDAELEKSRDALNKATIKHQEREEQLEEQVATSIRDFDAEREILKSQIDAISEQMEQSANGHAEELAKEQIGKHDQMMMALYIGGGILAVIGIIVFVWRRRANRIASEDMDRALDAQLKRVKEPHPLVPEYPSAHANRLGVHEHPAVRDVFGMKEPWDVTPGEGFHVAWVTKGGRTPETTRFGTDERGKVRIVTSGDAQNTDPQESEDVGESAEGVEKEAQAWVAELHGKLNI